MSRVAQARCDDWHGLTDADRRRLDGLVGALPGSVVYRLVRDEAGAVTVSYVSPAIAENFGLERDAVLADAGAWYALLHPGDRNWVMDAQAAAFADEDAFQATCRFNLPSGETRLFELRAAPETLNDGCLTWNGVATDVTQAEALRADRQHVLDLIDATPDFVFVTRVDGSVAYANPAARALGRKVGLDPDGMTLFDMHGPDTMAMFEREAFPALMKEGLWSGEAKVSLPGGVEMPIELVVVAHEGLDGRVTHFTSTARDLTQEHAATAALTEANAQIAVTLREVNHRMKNFFALVPALVKLSARTATDVGALSEAIQARIGALSRSHTLTLDTLASEHGIGFGALIDAVLEPYADAAETFELRGPDIRLSGSVGNAVALALHELATNAAKHGVFSTPGGKVVIAWSAEAGTPGERPRLRVVWDEAGGPPVSGPPQRSGFGTSLLDRLIGAQGGTITRDWRETGLRVEIVLPHRPASVSAALEAPGAAPGA